MESLHIQAGFKSICFGAMRDSTLKEGQTLVQHVFDVEEHITAGLSSITSKCLPATKINAQPYTIHFELTKDLVVSSSRCSCVAGIDGLCKHSAAVLTFINQERSTACIDIDQQLWKGPSSKAKSLYAKGESVKAMNGEPFCNVAFVRKESELEKDVMLEELKRFGLQDSVNVPNASSGR